MLGCAVVTLPDVRPLTLFDGLSDEELQHLLDAGDEVAFAPGDEVFREGQPADHWWILVDGALDLVRHDRGDETVVGRFEVPGQWAGGFRAWDDTGVYLATGRGTSPGRMLRVPATALREMVARYPVFPHLVQGLFSTARGIEATVRQRESLVSLGRISAGLAHELNNPASAASRAVDDLRESAATVLSALRRLAEGDLTAAQFAELDELRRELFRTAAEAAPSSALAAADREDALSDWLDDHGVGTAWSLAPPLAAAGADVAWCERLATTVGDPSLEPAVEWVASTLAVSGLLTEVKEATARISELVAAVRSYSQMDRAALQATDLTAGLDSTVAMLGHELSGITVTREYDPAVPTIDAYASELNQVWTILVDNAVDAMAGAGTLRLATRLAGDRAVVEVADDGPGMAEDVARQAFDAFFTTKEPGQGTGLGLDIARRIVVDRHQGTIEVAARTGGTTMRVTLPLLRPRG
jgi:signal transduction histidine kinase